MNNIRNFCIIAHIDHGKSTLADRFLEITSTVEKRNMKAQLLDQMDLERERGITIKLQPVRMLWHTTQINADLKTNADSADNKLIYEELTYKIRGAIFNVFNKLGPAFKENIYQRALKEELSKNDLEFESEKILNIYYDEKKVGTYKPDFIIEDKIIIELKALPFLGQLEKKQTWSYLKGSKYKLALLVNFGASKLQIERYIYDSIRKNPPENPQKSANVEYVLNLIDTPGHVDFTYEVSRSLAAVEGAILLVDATQGVQAQTLANLYQALDQNLVIIPVLNKIDLPNSDVEKVKDELVELLGFDRNEILAVSAKTGENVDLVLEEIIKKVPPPKGDPSAPTQALVFDSIYDNYRGVVAYIRVINGKIIKNDKIKLIATRSEDTALEVGTFSPKYEPKESLCAGEIGYVISSLKQVEDCKVGDTLTTQNSQLETRNNVFLEVEPLPGYKKVTPMVFASIYTADGEINKLRDALGKLKLNDASLSYEPENSSAFGFGFKCGFLGLLHMEIIKERLEREYGLSLVVTTPKVNYIEDKSSARVEYEEPWSKVEVIAPQNYTGAIMDLLDHNRGIYKEMRYIGERVILDYECPLAQIIVNFYDKLKSISAGYASMNYEMLEYRKEDLVKMDVLVAGEKIDVLEQIVHKTELQSKAHEITKKLKDLIPRQWFDVTIQAANGGKILARENIGALKKDVTGYLYGGDISRKKKLWAKQARGKKKMKKLGKVDIPTDVFINLLKN